jgi:pimeloyl-ACP methyl ester carboxylesterase
VIFAATSPARCRTLVTLGTPLQAYRAPERVQTLLLLLLYRLLGPVRFVQNGVVDTLLSPRTRAEEPRGGKDGPGVLGACRSGQGEQAVVSISLRRPDLSRFLRRVSAPTLFITGTDHQGWTPVQAEAFSQLLPDGSVAVVPDTAYLTKLEAPAETARLLRQFWAIHATPTQHN